MQESRRRTPRELRVAATSELYKHRRPLPLLQGRDPERLRAATESELYKHRLPKRLELLPEPPPPRRNFQMGWPRPQLATRASKVVAERNRAADLPRQG